jgi:hypothetical protein
MPPPPPILLLPVLLLPIIATVSAQVTLYMDTPLASGSLSGDVQTRLGLAPDATVHTAGGVALQAAAALRNPLLAALGIAVGTEEAGRPQATTAAYVAAPRSIAQTLRPTVGFSFGEARGAAASGTAGGYLVGEFAYNPVANQLGASVSGGSAGTATLRSGDSLGGVLAAGDAAGLSGAEALGWVDAQTTAGGGRSAQESQAIAYPTNALSPLNPATCTQSLTYGAARSNYLDGVAMPLIRGNEDGDGGEGDIGDGYGPAGGGAWGVPMCLALFDWGTLDDFVAFVEERPATLLSSEGEEGGGGEGDDGERPPHLRTRGDNNPSSSGGHRSSASFEDYVEEAASEEALHQSSSGTGGDGHHSEHKRRERAALRAIAAGGNVALPPPPSSSSSNSVLASLALAFEQGGQAAVEAFLRDTDLGREMTRRAGVAGARRRRAYEQGQRAPPLRETLARASAALVPSAVEARRAAAELRNVAARNATNLAVQALVATVESAEPALALQQRARLAVLQPLRQGAGRAAGGLLLGAAERLERADRRQQQQGGGGGAGGGGGGGGGGTRQVAFGDAAAALRSSAALAAKDVASVVEAEEEAEDEPKRRLRRQRRQRRRSRR